MSQNLYAPPVLTGAALPWWNAQSQTGDETVDPGGSGVTWLRPDWEATTVLQLGRAVDEVFAEAGTVRLARPYIDLDAGSAQDWTDLAVPAPTPVSGTPAVTSRRATDRPLAGTALVSRRELRERRKADESARTEAYRKLAKGGILAMAMFGAVGAQVPQKLHSAVVGGADANVAGTMALQQSMVGTVVDTRTLARDGVESSLKQQLVKTQQVQQVKDAAQDAGGVMAAVAAAQAASDEAARTAALAKAAAAAQKNPKALARVLLAQRGWGAGQFQCLDLLWTKESNWRWNAMNPSSGAYGIPQSLPARKMASHGADYRTNPAVQIKWGLDYISDRYGTPCAAWGHSQRVNWY